MNYNQFIMAFIFYFLLVRLIVVGVKGCISIYKLFCNHDVMIDETMRSAGTEGKARRNNAVIH